MRRRVLTLVTVMAVVLLAGSASADHARPVQQHVDGQVLIFGGELLNNPHDAVLQAHHQSRNYVNSHVTYGFDLVDAVGGGTFVVTERRADVQGTAGGDTWAVTFLDKRIGEKGARVVGYVDTRTGPQAFEAGDIPLGAKSAYVTATHGVNQSFRFTATAPEETH